MLVSRLQICSICGKIIMMEKLSGIKLKEGEVVEELFEGELKIIQNTRFYRFTSDSVLLSRFVKAKAHERVADFCAGSGIVGLHFFALNPERVESVVLFEMQRELSEMSKRTVALNNLSNFTVKNCKVQEIGREYDDAFSLILVNPPYETGGFDSDDYKKAVCRKEITITLSEIIEAAYRKLKFGGRLALVNRADRVAEVLFAMKARGIEPKRLQFVRGRADAKPYLLLVEGAKGRKEGVDVLPDIVNTK